MKIARLKYIAKTKIYFTILSLHLLFALGVQHLHEEAIYFIDFYLLLIKLIPYFFIPYLYLILAVITLTEPYM